MINQRNFMKFWAKLLSKRGYPRVELFVESPSVLGGTRIFCECDDVERLEKTENFLHKKISEELDRVSDLKSTAIQTINEMYFDLGNVRDAINGYSEACGGDADKMTSTLARYGINQERLLAFDKNGLELKKLHEVTKSLAIIFDEGSDYSHTYQMVKDPFGRIWQVGHDYVEGWFDEWGSE